MIHFAGLDVTISGRHQRQRCAWCGAVLVDRDLSRVAVQVGPDGDAAAPGFWSAGSLVDVDEHEGAPLSTRFMSVVELAADEKLPDGTCYDVDPEISR